MSDSSEALLPCPFCGAANIDPAGWASTETSGPACDDCGASAGSTLKPQAENIAAWNTRPSSPAASDGDAVREAAKPFARAADNLPRWAEDHHTLSAHPGYVAHLNVGHLRALRAALPPSPSSDGGAVREALIKARDQFRFYAAEHERKAEAAAYDAVDERRDEAMRPFLAKAKTNRDFADMCDAALASSPASSTDVEVLRQMTPAKAGAMVAAMGLRTQRACTPGEKLEARRDSEAVEALANALPAIRDALERERDAREIIRGLLSVIDEAANSEAGENAERQVIRAARQFVGSEQ